MIRPERLQLTAGGFESNADNNQLNGRVREAIYGGTAIRYVVDVTETDTLEVELPSHDLPTGIDVGAAVTVHWRVTDTRVVAT